MRPSSLAILLAFATTFPRLATGAPIYVGKFQPQEIDQVDASGNVSLFQYPGADPLAMVVDGSGNLFVATQANQIYKVTSQGSASLFAGTGLNYPSALAFDASGNLFAANEGNRTIEKFDSQGNGSLFANTGIIQPAGGMAFDNQGNLFVSLEGNSTIEKYDSQGNGSLFATVATTSAMTFGNGSLYVATGGNAIFKLDQYGNLSLFTTSGLDGPVGLAFDSNGNLYCANAYNGTITKYDSHGNESLFATDSYLNSIAIQPVPEPATWLLGAVGQLFLLAVSRRR